MALPIDIFIDACKLLGGGHDKRWQASAAAQLGISRGYMHLLLTGERPLTKALMVKAMSATRAAFDHHEHMAKRLNRSRTYLEMFDLDRLDVDNQFVDFAAATDDDIYDPV